MKKSISVSFFFVSSLLIATSGTIQRTSLTGPNTIHISYDAQDGKFSTGEVTITKQARKGITWKKLYKGEKPASDPISNQQGYTFKTYQYLDSNNELKDITDDYVFDKNTTLYARYSNKSFQYDTWENLITIAENQGLEGLKTYYEPANDTFIGMTKEITYANKVYTVRVIGEGADKIVNSTNKTALTFEFVDLIDGISYNPVSNKNNEYKISNIRDYLNTTVKNNLPTFVGNHIQKIEKQTYRGNGAASRTIDKTQDYCFLLSLKEMKITTDLYNNAVEDEGSLYSYYNFNSTQASRKKYYKYDDGTRVESLYWTRSPYTGNTDTAWCIEKDGHLGSLYDASESKYEPLEVEFGAGIAPAFSIGVTMNHNPSFADDSWENIIKYANEGEPSLINHYKEDWESEEYFEDVSEDILPHTTKNAKKPKDSLLGLTHPLIMTEPDGSKKEYQVKIIGVNHDFITNPSSGGTKKKATLTFEFESNYTGSMGVNYSDNSTAFYNNRNYKGSTLQNYMDTTVYGRFPDAVKNAIKTVYKYHLTVNTSSAKCSAATDQFKVFPLSFTEYGRSSSTWPWSKDVGGRTKTGYFFSYEGDSYDYYKYDENEEPDIDYCNDQTPLRIRRRRAKTDTSIKSSYPGLNGDNGSHMYLRSVYSYPYSDYDVTYTRIPGMYSAGSVSATYTPEGGQPIDISVWGPGSMNPNPPINDNAGSCPKRVVSPAFCIGEAN